MKRRYKIGLGVIGGGVVGALIGVGLSSLDFQVLNPQGVIAREQLQLLIFATLLSLVVVIPVFALVIFIGLRYREGNKKATYRPNEAHNSFAEAIWWGIPCVLIGIISIVIWQSSHALDPYRPIVSDKAPINVQVVALQWRWLFIYPDEKVASINYLNIPVGTPVNFTITADAPMNSFWIPKLGGQVYAMNGMSTKLHLMADTEGDFPGSSVNISGKGFAKMKFVTHASSDLEYQTWIEKARANSGLDWGAYQTIAKPSEDTSQHQYALKDVDLYDKIVMKYMSHEDGQSGGHDHEEGHGE